MGQSGDSDLGRQAIGEGCGGTPPASKRPSPSLGQSGDWDGNDPFAQMTTDDVRALAESEPTTGWPELIRELAIEEIDERTQALRRGRS